MYNTFNPNAQICCKKRAWFQENALWFESFPWWRLNLCHTCPPVMEVNKRHIGFAGGLWCVFKVAILAKHPCSTENFHTWNTKTKQQFYIQSPNCIHDIWCIYIYIYLLDLSKLPMKIYTIHVGKSSHPVFFYDPSTPPSESRNPGATSMVKARTFGWGFSAPGHGCHWQSPTTMDDAPYYNVAVAAKVWVWCFF